MDIRRFGAAVPLAALRARAHARGVLDVLRHQSIPVRSGARAAAARLARLRAAHRERRELRREVGLGAGRTGSTRTPPTATSRCARAAGPGGTGRPRSRPSAGPPSERAVLIDQSSFAKLDVRGPGALRVPPADVRERRRPARRGRSSTRSCSTRAGASRPTSRSCGSRPTATSTSRARRSARTTSPGCARTCPATARCGVDDVSSARTLLLPVGPARPRHPAAAHATATSRTRPSRTCARRRSPSAPCRCSPRA